MRWWMLLLLWWAVPAPLTLALDTPPADTVHVRSFDAERIAELKNDPDLEYDRELVHAPSWWERFKAWLRDLLNRLAGPGVGAFISSNFAIMIAIIVVVIALVVLSRGSLRRVFHGAPRGLGEVTAIEEDIRGLDLEAMIREAEQKNDLRRAIRLHYLLVLRKLVDQEVLKWSPEYTDHDYMRQVRDPGLRSRFAHVALVFQWVWYGSVDVDAERYASIKRPFVEFETVPAR